MQYVGPGKGLAQKIGVYGESRVLIWSIIVFGIALRLIHYFHNRSLWLDEARIALNIVNRSFAQLLQPLAYDQGAPLGFLMVEKVATLMGGNNEYALRFLPLLAGLISIFLFYKVAPYYLKTGTVPVALGLFAISEYLVNYSTEAKQYSSDVATGLILTLAALYIQSGRLAWLDAVWLGLVGLVAIWFSHPAIFMLAGLGGTLIFFSLINRQWQRAGWLSLACLFWAVSLGVLYFVSLRDLSHNQALLRYWQGSFMPLPPASFSDLGWFISAFFKIFEDPGGLILAGLPAFTFVVGGASIFKHNKEKFFILIAPLLLALLASGFQVYPFKGRLLLFIVPALLLFIAAGVEQIWHITQPHSAMIGLALVGLLFLQPLRLTLHNLSHAPTKEEIKPVIGYMKSHEQPGDLLYLYYGAIEAFKYYQPTYGYRDQDYITGIYSQNWAGYASDLDKLRGHQRVWILFSHLSDETDEEIFFLYYLDSIGQRIDSFKSEGAAVYLYDLSHRS